MSAETVEVEDSNGSPSAMLPPEKLGDDKQESKKGVDHDLEVKVVEGPALITKDTTEKPDLSEEEEPPKVDQKKTDTNVANPMEPNLSMDLPEILPLAESLQEEAVPEKLVETVVTKRENPSNHQYPYQYQWGPRSPPPPDSSMPGYTPPPKGYSPMPYHYYPSSPHAPSPYYPQYPYPSPPHYYPPPHERSFHYSPRMQSPLYHSPQPPPHYPEYAFFPTLSSHAQSFDPPSFPTEMKESTERPRGGNESKQKGTSADLQRKREGAAGSEEALDSLAKGNTTSHDDESFKESVTDASQLRTYTKVAPNPIVLERREHKNSQSRKRSNVNQQQIDEIRAKPSNFRTSQENEKLDQFDKMREHKNARSKERAVEKKETLDKMLAKPAHARTQIEQTFVDQYLDSKKRKNEGDRLRRARLKKLGLNRIASTDAGEKIRVTARGPWPPQAATMHDVRNHPHGSPPYSSGVPCYPHSAPAASASGYSYPYPPAPYYAHPGWDPYDHSKARIQSHEKASTEIETETESTQKNSPSLDV
jgi:hypothetical protein